MKKDTLLREEGSILIVALVFLVLLTLMGISALSTTDVELQIAYNDTKAKENFYNAEAAAMEGLQELENAGNAIKNPAGIDWLHLALPEPGDILHATNWDPELNNSVGAVGFNNKQRYLAVFEGIGRGSSIVLGGSRVFKYRVVGRGGDINSSSSGNAVVEMGFKKPL